jgi:hypothetical protein
MGKPDKAVFFSSRNARRPVSGRGARLGAVNSRPKVSFPSRFWSAAGDSVLSSAAILYCFLKNRAAYRVNLVRGQQNCLMARHAARIVRVRALVVGMEKNPSSKCR